MELAYFQNGDEVSHGADWWTDLARETVQDPQLVERVLDVNKTGQNALEHFSRRCHRLYFQQKLSKDQYFQTCCLAWMVHSMDQLGVPARRLWEAIPSALGYLTDEKCMADWLHPKLELADLTLRSVPAAIQDPEEAHVYLLLLFWKRYYQACESQASLPSRPTKRARTAYDYYSFSSTSSNTSSFDDLLKGSYKLPAAVLLVTLGLEVCLPKEGLVVWTRVHEYAHGLSRTFKALTVDDIQAALTVVGMKCIKQRRASPGLTSVLLANQYLTRTGESVLSVLKETTQLDYYPLRATICMHLLQPVIDSDKGRDLPSEQVEEIIATCADFLNREQPISYIQRMVEEEEDRTDTLSRRRRLEPIPRVPERISEAKFPITTHLDVWLLQDEIWKAADLARTLDGYPNVDEMLKEEAYNRVWQYLLECGLLFLDGNYAQTREYAKKRELLYNGIVSGAGASGKGSMIDFYQTVATRVWEHPEATVEEKHYVLVACQHTLLRLLLKCLGLGNSTVAKFLRDTNWPVPINTSAGTLSPELDTWAAHFLSKPNPIPESLLTLPDGSKSENVDINRILWDFEEEEEVMPLLETAGPPVEEPAKIPPVAAMPAPEEQRQEEVLEYDEEREEVYDVEEEEEDGDDDDAGRESDVNRYLDIRDDRFSAEEGVEEESSVEHVGGQDESNDDDEEEDGSDSEEDAQEEHGATLIIDESAEDEQEEEAPSEDYTGAAALMEVEGLLALGRAESETSEEELQEIILSSDEEVIADENEQDGPIYPHNIEQDDAESVEEIPDDEEEEDEAPVRRQVDIVLDDDDDEEVDEEEYAPEGSTERVDSMEVEVGTLPSRDDTADESQPQQHEEEIDVDEPEEDVDEPPKEARSDFDDPNHAEGQASQEDNADSDATEDDEDLAPVEERAPAEDAASAHESDLATSSQANMLADADRRADLLAARAGYNSQLEEGYEAEDTHGSTEEEVSEAMHTEDEEEERKIAQAAQAFAKQRQKKLDQALHGMAHSSDDMYADDEHTDEHTEHEEDLGNESSELEETTEVREYAFSPSSEHDPKSLLDFAQSAQRLHQSGLQPSPARAVPTTDPVEKGNKSVGFIDTDPKETVIASLAPAAKEPTDFQTKENEESAKAQLESGYYSGNSASLEEEKDAELTEDTFEPGDSEGVVAKEEEVLPADEVEVVEIDDEPEVEETEKHDEEAVEQASPTVEEAIKIVEAATEEVAEVDDKPKEDESKVEVPKEEPVEQASAAKDEAIEIVEEATEEMADPESIDPEAEPVETLDDEEDEKEQAEAETMQESTIDEVEIEEKSADAMEEDNKHAPAVADAEDKEVLDQAMASDDNSVIMVVEEEQPAVEEMETTEVARQDVEDLMDTGDNSQAMDEDTADIAKVESMDAADDDVEIEEVVDAEMFTETIASPSKDVPIPDADTEAEMPPAEDKEEEAATEAEKPVSEMKTEETDEVEDLETNDEEEGDKMGVVVDEEGADEANLDNNADDEENEAADDDVKVAEAAKDEGVHDLPAVSNLESIPEDEVAVPAVEEEEKAEGAADEEEEEKEAEKSVTSRRSARQRKQKAPPVRATRSSRRKASEKGEAVDDDLAPVSQVVVDSNEDSADSEMEDDNSVAPSEPVRTTRRTRGRKKQDETDNESETASRPRRSIRGKVVDEKPAKADDEGSVTSSVRKSRRVSARKSGPAKEEKEKEAIDGTSVASSARRSARTSGRKRATPEPVEEENTEEAEVPPKPKRATRSSKAAATDEESIGSKPRATRSRKKAVKEDDGQSVVSTRSTRSTASRTTRARAKKVQDGPEEKAEPKSRRRSTRARNASASEDGDQSEEEEEKPQTRQRGRPPKPPKAPTRSSARARKKS